MRNITKFVSLACSAWIITSAYAQTEKPPPKPQNPASVEIRDWFALGSGCKAKFDIPGDVTMEYLGASKADKNSYTVRFHLKKYELDGNNPINKNNPTFARQCAMRFGFYMPKGFQIKAMSSETNITFTKAPEVKLELASQMLVGAVVIGPEVITIEKADNITTKTEKLVVKAENGKGDFPAQSCGAPKVLGLDLSITNFRDKNQAKSAVKASLLGDKFVDINVSIEPCAQTAK